VPIGSINKPLIEETIPILQDKIKINIILCEELAFEPGKIDRSNAEKYISNLYQSMQEKMNPAEFKQMKAEFQVKDNDLQDYTIKKNFVRYVYRKALSKSQYLEFNSRLMELEENGQYNAVRLIDLLAKKAMCTPSRVSGDISESRKKIFTPMILIFYSACKGGPMV